MDVPQMQTVRKVLSSAAKSADDAERRMATLMLQRFDEFTAPLAPQLAEARRLYARAMRGEQLETLRELAESRTGQFSGSGFENALRTEYRQLNNRIIKGKERGWTPEQAEAIKRVAEGTGASNALRNLGRMAPTGPVSFMSAAGLPFGIGTAVGGPVAGAAAATGMSMLGYGARAAASQMGSRNALLAELIARNGGALAAPKNEAIWGNILLNALYGNELAGQK